MPRGLGKRKSTSPCAKAGRGRRVFTASTTQQQPESTQPLEQPTEGAVEVTQQQAASTSSEVTQQQVASTSYATSKIVEDIGSLLKKLQTPVPDEGVQVLSGSQGLAHQPIGVLQGPITGHLDRGFSPIKVDSLKKFLANYPNREKTRFLLDGFEKGFRLQFTGPRVAADAPNLLSVQHNPIVALNLVLKEVANGRVAGPFTTLPIYNLKLSPLGLVPKKDGSMRLIHHLSYPRGASVNDFIEDSMCSVHYSSFDNVVDMVNGLGIGALMAKMDIKSAFRLLPVHPDDFCLLGFKLGDHYFVDKCMPMGCKISCSIFESFSTCLQWIVESESLSGSEDFGIDHYLDDFFFAGRVNTNLCEGLMHSFSKICSDAGIPLAREKTVGPDTTIVFLGLEIDSLRREIRIPQKKLFDLKHQLLLIMDKKKATLKELQSLAGSLNFCTKAIPVARAFIRRLYDSMSGVTNQKFFIRVSLAMKEDIKMWILFLDLFNGICKFPDLLWLSDYDLHLYTDSAGLNYGCAAFFEPHWSFFIWPSNWSDKDIIRDITCLELIPILLAFLIWPCKLANKRVILHTDNKALVSILNKKTSRSKRVMHFVRPLLVHAMLQNIQFKAVHIEGVQNQVADAISRQQWSRFRHLAPRADKDPAPVPQMFTSIVYDTRLIDY